MELNSDHCHKYPSNHDFEEEDIVEIPINNQEVRLNHIKLPMSYYFPLNPSHIRMTNHSIYSITPWKEANFISRSIVNFFREGKFHLPVEPHKPKIAIKRSLSMGHLPESPLIVDNRQIVITDGTAHIGGNTISFYLNGLAVNAVEINPMVCELLKHNLKEYKLATDHVYCADYVEVFRTLKQDAVYLDCSWGGPNYKSVKCLDLYLSQTNLIDICYQLISEQLTKLIILKLPINYNLPALIAKMPNRNFLTQKIYRGQNRHSYNVVFCW